jgi:hypothetical protein
MINPIIFTRTRMMDVCGVEGDIVTITLSWVSVSQRACCQSRCVVTIDDHALSPRVSLSAPITCAAVSVLNIS